jgi:hypothetical protein
VGPLRVAQLVLLAWGRSRLLVPAASPRFVGPVWAAVGLVWARVRRGAWFGGRGPPAAPLFVYSLGSLGGWAPVVFTPRRVACAWSGIPPPWL